jgi:hypothetical protein
MPCISTSEQCNHYFETNLLLSTGTYPVSTHTQVSSGVLLTKIYVLNYILIYNDQTTLRAGTCRHGVECRWAQRTGRKKRKKKVQEMRQKKERKKNTQETSVSWAWCWVLWWWHVGHTVRHVSCMVWHVGHTVQHVAVVRIKLEPRKRIS